MKGYDSSSYCMVLLVTWRSFKDVKWLLISLGYIGQCQPGVANPIWQWTAHQSVCYIPVQSRSWYPLTYYISKDDISIESSETCRNLAWHSWTPAILCENHGAVVFYRKTSPVKTKTEAHWLVIATFVQANQYLFWLDRGFSCLDHLSFSGELISCWIEPWIFDRILHIDWIKLRFCSYRNDIIIVMSLVIIIQVYLNYPQARWSKIWSPHGKGHLMARVSSWGVVEIPHEFQS